MAMASAQTTHRYRPTPTDGFPTPTSRTQAETEAVLRDHLPSRASPSTSSTSAPTSASTSSPAPTSPAPGSSTDASASGALLQKKSHMQFLIKHLIEGFPKRYVSQDASQPWLMFWTLQAFSVLQVGIDRGNGQRIIDKVLTWQHPEGGFGGGPGQAPHLLATYAAVCCLAIVGRGGENGGWDQIDREKLYAFFMSVKQPDGSFTVGRGAEVDVRGIYCLLAVATLLDLLTPELVAGTPEFLASCQTYEGGFASGSVWSGLFGREGETGVWEGVGAVRSSPIGSGGGAGLGAGGGAVGNKWGGPAVPNSGRARPALGEAHGGYTFCALASWVLLQPFVGVGPSVGGKGVLGAMNANVPSSPSPPSTSQAPHQDTSDSQAEPQAQISIPALLRWLVSMQGSPAELGGFRGRTNKLVDGCYSWWCGGAFALLEALGVGGMQNAVVGEEVVTQEGGTTDANLEVQKEGQKEGEKDGAEEGNGGVDVWDEVDDGLFNRTALQEYILYAGQHPAGGLRDKPPKNADSYHTLYCLSGLSAAQHHVFPSRVRKAQVEEAWRGNGRDTPEENERRKSAFAAMMSWTEEEGTSIIVGGPGNRVNATHPLTNLTITHTEAMASHFYGQRVPPRARPVVRKA